MNKARAPAIPSQTYRPNTPYFDLFATPAKGSPLEALAADVATMLATNEPRQKARKAGDAATFARCVEAVVCNLALSVLTMRGGPVAVSLRHESQAWRPSRYNNHGLKARTFRGVIEGASDSGLLRITLSATHGRASTIKPSPEFAAEVLRRGVTREDIAEHKGVELIVYARRVRKRDEARGWQQEAERELVEYVDAPTIVAARREMRALNDHLKAAPLAFLDDGQLPIIDDNKL